MIKRFVRLWNVINILIAKDSERRRVRHIEGNTGFVETTGIRGGIFSQELL